MPTTRKLHFFPQSKKQFAVGRISEQLCPSVLQFSRRWISKVWSSFASITVKAKQQLHFDSKKSKVMIAAVPYFVAQAGSTIIVPNLSLREHTTCLLYGNRSSFSYLSPQKIHFVQMILVCQRGTCRTLYPHLKLKLTMVWSEVGVGDRTLQKSSQAGLSWN